ncbi:MAG TPA: alpha-hydroxy acid oxidase [Casimicrobiaceae bacterium]|nr:alpha-hydroxy acid oxidase [Casimicrobiaceae bacterium]
MTRRRLASLLCLDDFERAARRHLPRAVFEYVAGGAETDSSLRDNRAAFSEWGFLPRALVDVSGVSTRTTLFGHDYEAPFGIAPLGLAALFAYRGDLLLAKAAHDANIPMMMSGTSLIRVEEIAASYPSTWFQAYLPGDVDGNAALIERIARTKIDTLVVTVDCQIAGNRENNIRAGFTTPLRPSVRLAVDGITHPRWLFGTFVRTFVKHGAPHFENNFATRGAPILSRNVLRDYSDRGRLDWSQWRRVRELWKGRLLIKGILDKADALRARDGGADGIIVSNHGGRQLDGAVSALRVLPEIVQSVRDVPVMVDGGVRRGTDVLKALALGAAFVFVGRPFAYGAAIAGVSGVMRAIDILRTEIARDMGMLGVTRLAEVDRARLFRIDARPS